MAAPTTRREEVTFPPNTPVTLALKYAQGKRVASMNGERMMLTTTDNRVAFLDLDVAAQIERLGVNVGENFILTKRWDGKKDSPAIWEAARVYGQQPNGTYTVPAIPDPVAKSRGAAGEVATTVSPAAPPNVAPPAAFRKPVASEGLILEAEGLVDTYAEVLKRAIAKHAGLVKNDDVKTLVITAYIQRSKLSSVA